MGMYTGLRCKVKIKEEYIAALKELENIDYEWSEHSIKEFRDFGELPRASFIPCGALAYMPGCWEKLKENAVDKYDTEDVDEFKRGLNEESRIWTFQCSLKDYDNEIEYFIKNIIPIISDEVYHLEKLYEEWETSILYKMDESKNIVEVEDGYIYVDEKYGCSLSRPVLVSEYDKMSRGEIMELFLN